MSPDFLARLVVRGDTVLAPDPRRVLARQFLPGQEILADGRARVDAVIGRVLAMPAAEVGQTLAATVAAFTDRHDDLAGIFGRHADAVAGRLRDETVTDDQRTLIGAYLTQEYALEAAALFNPSMVTHPDQSGLEAGELRFLMTVRSVGEGHVSSIQLRSGVLGAAPRDLWVDPAGRPRLAQTSAATMSREVLLAALVDRAGVRSDHLASLLPDPVDRDNLGVALDAVRQDFVDRGRGSAAAEQLNWAFSCDYVAELGEGPLADAVLFPTAPDESHGMEDARCTRFVEDDGTVTYLATYTAYDGADITSHLITTADFRHAEVSQLLGPSAKNKGMAIFPRRVGGDHLALVRWDRESIGVARSDDLRWWQPAVTVEQPRRPWELIQLGNCGPPIETEAGWLVLDHGVGPVRQYGIGALLLDLHDPTRLIGALSRPLLLPQEDERAGYVPNVVYSCGGLRHGDTLVIPYGCSDSAIRFAFVDLPGLLAELRA
ncbi:glycoside hydrolase family 130 protein [uncultured Friedmanniella sp.]|uniref:glycoside hydrolase family 130 protein n=1 Tax=uncultured Friedmanniella sp. TaxID=335381 RepID=UPI0035C9C765